VTKAGSFPELLLSFNLVSSGIPSPPTSPIEGEGMHWIFGWKQIYPSSQEAAS